MNRPVCFITGVGEATGAAIAERFARDGYAVAMVARNVERLARLEAEIPGTHACPCDIGHREALSDIMAKVQNEIGSPSAKIERRMSPISVLVTTQQTL